MRVQLKVIFRKRHNGFGGQLAWKEVDENEIKNAKRSEERD